jgi:hypothetical protein
MNILQVITYFMKGDRFFQQMNKIDLFIDNISITKNIVGSLLNSL